MAEERTVPVQLEVLLAQMRLANLKLENCLTFFALLRAKENQTSALQTAGNSTARSRNLLAAQRSILLEQVLP